MLELSDHSIDVHRLSRANCLNGLAQPCIRVRNLRGTHKIKIQFLIDSLLMAEALQVLDRWHLRDA
jgi:hypothetical protein